MNKVIELIEAFCPSDVENELEVSIGICRTAHGADGLDLKCSNCVFHENFQHMQKMIKHVKEFNEYKRADD